ncbi:MAG: hydrogenase maturation peptidase HycI [Bacillota bacterium]|nr:MAG: hydrogenase maturation peptidase HycI [Bacillota bacterium]
MTRLVMTVGNELMGDDAAGPLLARRLSEAPIPGWTVLDCGPVPENHLHRVREMAPDLVVVVDACEMGLPPGSVRRIPEGRIAGEFFLTTHRLPLSFVLGALRELGAEVLLVGIQPRAVAFGLPVSPEVERAVAEVYEGLRAGRPDFPWLEEG